MRTVAFDFNDTKAKEYLASIGAVVVLLGHLEYLIEFIIWDLVNPQADDSKVRQLIAERITVGLEYMEKLKLLRSLTVERKGDKKAKEFIGIYKKCIAVCEIRNDIAHSMWIIEYGNIKEGESPSTTKTNMKKAFPNGKQLDLSAAYKKVDLDEIKSYMEQINQTISELFSFFF